MADTLFDELGGMPCLEKVHVLFYEKLLKHPWLKGFFTGMRRENLESQQSEFMKRLFGGSRTYSGRMPKAAHIHMFITEEVFMVRHEILDETLTEIGVRSDLKKRWLDYDMGMKKALVKNDISECAGRFKTEPIIVVEKP